MSLGLGNMSTHFDITLDAKGMAINLTNPSGWCDVVSWESLRDQDQVGGLLNGSGEDDGLFVVRVSVRDKLKCGSARSV